MKSFNKIAAWLVTLISVFTVACIVSIVMICVNGAKPDIYTHRGEDPQLSDSELRASFDYGDGYVKKIIFVGDKTISHMPSVFSGVELGQVWSSISGSLPLDNNLKTIAIIHSAEDTKGCSIPSAAEIYKPQYVIITVGLENGVAYCNEEKFKEYYTELIVAIKEASPSTNIILQSIFPISKQAEKENPNISNDRINRANKWIIDICEASSVRFLNTASVLKDSDGYLSSKYDSGDGITLGAEGYEAVIKYIRTHGYK